MNPHWKPEGYPSISPYLVVEDAEAVLTFMKEAFDATDLRRYDMPDGSIMHAEVRIGDGVVMIGQAGGDWPPLAQMIHLYVEDVDAAYEKALEAGGVPLQEPTRKDGDPDRRGGIRDPGGNSWWISTQTS